MVNVLSLKGWVVSICFLVTTTVCAAQQDATLQKLVQQLQKSKSENDTVRVDVYIEFGRYYSRRQYDSAGRYFTAGLELSTKIGFTKGMLRCLSQLGTITKNQGDYRKAIDYYRKSLLLAAKLKNTAATGAIYNNLGNTYVKTGQFDSALYFLQKSLEIKIAQNDEEGIVNSCINMGNFFASNREFDAAKRYYKEGLAVENKLNDPARKSKLYVNLGNAYYETNRFDSAQDCYEKALKITSTSGQQTDWISIYHNLGNIHKQKGDYTEALALYRKGLELCESSGDTFKAINALNNIGNVYKLENDCNQALDYYEDALKKARSINSPDQVKMLLYNISECNEKLNNLYLALADFKKAKVLADDLYFEERAALLAEMQTRFDTEQKEKALLQQKALHDKKLYERNIFILLASLLFILLCIAVFVYRKTRMSNQLLAAQKKVIEKREHEKELLLRELHHRSKNNLQLISSLLNLQAHQLKDTEAERAVKEGQARVEAMALIHRDLYRGENITTVNLKTYLEKMISNLASSYNFSSTSIELHQDIQEIELGADLAIPLGLIANELISNTFKHAFTHQERPRLDVIAKELRENELHILIRDNGKGIETHPSKENTFGMNMVDSLVKQLSGQITFENIDGCFATLIVPIVRKESLAEV